MRVTFIALAVLGLFYGTTALPVQPRGLNEDLQDFVDLIPVAKILDIVVSNLEDPEVQAVIDFIFSDECKDLLVQIEKIPEFNQVIAYLDAAGLPVHDWIQWVHDLIGLSRSSPSGESRKGLNSVIQQIKAVLPIDEIKALYNKKLTTSPDFKKLVDKLQSPVFKGLTEALKSNKEVQKIVARLEAVGVDVKGFIELLKQFFGLNYTAYSSPVRGLNEDLQDFIALIPKEQIVEIVKKNLKDPEVQAVIEFLFSDECKALVIEISNIPEYKQVIAYLESTGLPVRRWIQWIHDFLGISRSTPDVASSRGLSSIIKEIEAILPMDKIIALYNNKLATSPDFKTLIEKLNSPVFKGLTNALKANKAVQKIVSRLEAVGVDVKGFIALLKKFFGITYSAYSSPVRGLNEDLQDFIALIPKEQIVEIVKKNLKDPEVQAVIEFLFSDECKALVIEISNIPEYKQVIAYLESTGLPVRRWIQWIHDFLGISRSTPDVASSRGLSSIIKEIEAILPMDKIIALYNNKLATSPDFKTLIEKLNSPVFKGLTNALKANKAVQKIVSRLEAVGVDVKGFIALLKKFFGITYSAYSSPVRGLNEDLQDFIALIPKEQIVEIVKKNLKDPEVQAVIEFLFSDECKALVIEISNIPEYKQVIAYLESTGLPVRRWIQWIHDFLGISRSTPDVASSRGLSSIIKEIEAILPMDKIIALYNNKLATSPDFKTLIEKLNSPVFKGLTNALKANKAVQKIVSRLEAVGVDVKGFIALLKKFFGITYSAYSSPVRGLNEDLQDFIALIPKEQIVEIVKKNLKDPEVQAVIEFLFSDECKALVIEISNIPEYKQVIAYLESTGLPVRRWIQWIHDFLGISRSTPDVASSRGLSSIIKEIEAILPMDKIIALYNNKLATSPDFKTLIEKLNSPVFKGLTNALKANKAVQKIVSRLEAVGVDVKGFIALLKKFFGITYSAYSSPVRGLNEDLQDFIALIPKEQIVEIVKKNLKDPEVQAVIEFLFSDECKALVIEISNIPEYKQVIAYLESTGLPVRRWIQWIHDFLGISRSTPDVASSRGLSSIIKEIEAILPMDKIIALYNNKLATSPDFKTLIEKLNSPVFKGLTNALKANKAVQKIVSRLEAVGVDVKGFIALLKKFFGITYSAYSSPVRGLNEDLQDFIALIPKEQIVEIVKKNLKDPEVQAVIEFLFSDECKALVIEISNIPEYKQVIAYLESTGLPVRRWIQWIHDFLGISRSTPDVASSRGLSSIIKEIEAILPMDKIIALYNNKLATSPDFKTLIEKLNSPVFKGLTNALKANKAVQKIVSRLEAVGVDVKGFIALLKKFFGITYSAYSSPVRGLNEDLQDFIALIPKEQIVEIVKKNLKDPEVQAVIEFLFSDECKALVIEISNIPEYKQVIAYLESTGLPVRRWIQWIHDFLGISRSTPNVASSRGLSSIIKEIEAILPMDKIIALYNNKLATSPDFKTLIEKLNSPVFKGLTNALKANKAVQKIVSRLEAVGVDVKGFIALLKKFFGITYSAYSSPVRGLNEDLQDFIALIPKEQIVEIVKKNLKDPEVQAVIEFLFSDECKALVIEISNIPEYKQVIAYLESTGLPVRRWIQWIHDFLGISRSTPDVASSRGLSSIIKEIEAILPMDKIIALYNNKLATSPDFKTLIEKLNSPVFKGLTNALKANKAVQKIVSRLEAVGVDVKGFIALLKKFFGITYSAYSSPVRGLNEDLQDFIALIPKEQIVEIVKKNLKDPEVQAVIEFLFSDECKALVIEISNIPEYKQVIAYLESTGLPVRRWIQWIHDFLGISRSTPDVASSRGLSSIIKEIEAILPMDKIIALYNNKLATSPDFKTLIEKLNSPVFKGLTNALKANKAVQKIVSRLEAVGVDVKGFIALLKKFFGITYSAYSSPVRGLNEDLQDFIALIPKEQIVEIVKKNLKDPEVQAVIEFLFSDECKALVIEISNIPEYKQVIAYLESTGLPVRRWIQWIHDFLGISRSTPDVASSRGLSSIIKEIEAILPMDKIIALYNNKLATSPDFKTLIEKLNSPVFKGLTNALKANKAVQKIVSRLEAVGVDVKGFIALLKKFFGITYSAYSSPVRGLNEDLQDFIALIPKEQIVEIVKKNLKDPEVQAVIEFLFSDECKALVIEISNIPEYKQVIAYLESTGLPVRRWIQWIHDFLGISRSTPDVASSRGLSSIIKEIEAILPMDKIIALYNNKLATSPDFKTLIEKLNSPVFKGLTNALKANKAVQKIVSRLEAVGVDVKGFIALLKKFFGITYSAYSSPVRGLNEDLQDFIALIPKEQIVEIVKKNLKDPEVQAVIEFLFSDECKALVIEISNIPEYKQVIAYLESTGLPVRRWIQWIHDFLGISRSTPDVASSRGLSSIIKEIEAILPMDKIIALYNNKLATSPDFKTLIEKLNSPVFKGLTNALKANKAVQKIVSRLEAVGVDVKGFIALLKKFFGITYSAYSSPVRGLNEDLQDFIDLIPQDKVVEIVMRNLEDPEVQATIEFLFSEECKNLVIEISKIPEYTVIVAYLDEAGLPVHYWIERIHEFFGITRSSTTGVSTRGLNSIIQEIKAILPLDKIAALYREKLTKSPEFKKLVEKLQSPVFKGMTDALKANKAIQKIVARLEAVGVDVKGFIELLKKIFGLTF